MSQQRTILESPRIYSSTVEQSNKKVFFKLFLINNKLSLPTEPYNVVWGATNPNSLHEDVDTFIGTSITQKDKNGAHPNIRDAGIFEHNYNNKADYVKAAVDFYNGHSIAKIVDVYKPDSNMLLAASKNPDMMLQYDAMGVTENEEFIKYLDKCKKENKDIYVSPGVYALDSYKDDKGRIIVNKFVGLHSSIVDHPAHTEPIAFVKKETCNVDHKTCYYKLLTASEMLNLNNNNSEIKDMANTPPGNNSQPQATIIEGNPVNAIDPNTVQSRTEVKDAKGNVTEVINNNPSQSQQEQLKKEKEIVNKEIENKTQEAKKEIDNKKEKTEEELKGLTKDQLIEYMGTFKSDIIKEIEQRSEQKFRQAKRADILNTYIPVSNEALKEDHQFYKNLPISPDQLQKVLEHSRFNPEIQKAILNHKTTKPFEKLNSDKPDNNYTAGAISRQGAITSDRVNVSTYNDKNTGYSAGGQTTLRHLTSGRNIPKKFQN